MLELSDPRVVVDARKASIGAVARGSDRAKMDTARKASCPSARPPVCMIEAESPQIMTLARRIRESIEEAEALKAHIAATLGGDNTYGCPLTMPGIGPRTPFELVIAIDICAFPDHGHLTSRSGIAPRNRQPGTSTSSANATKQGNNRLEILLVFLYNSLARNKSRLDERHYRCRERSMRHGEVEAVTRKRFEVIYSIMRDNIPYSAYCSRETWCENLRPYAQFNLKFVSRRFNFNVGANSLVAKFL